MVCPRQRRRRQAVGQAQRPAFGGVFQFAHIAWLIVRRPARQIGRRPVGLWALGGGRRRKNAAINSGMFSRRWRKAECPG